MRRLELTVLALALSISGLIAAPNTGVAKKVDRYAEGTVKAQWTTLLAGGCNVAKADVSTPLEARVLRNTPYALKGKIFKSAELTELFTDDGDWYKAKTKSPTLSKKAKTCVGKLKKWETKLRKRLPMKKKVEAFLTRDRRLYLDLRGVPYDAENYTGSGGRKGKDGAYYWSMSYSKACFKNPDCGAYTIMCELDPDTKKVKCLMVAAG